MSGVVLNVAEHSEGTRGYIWINWIRGGTGYGGNATNINANGCPVVAPPSSEISGHAWRKAISVPTSTQYSGHWVLKWTGTGAYSITTQDATITVDSGGGFVVSNSGTTMLVSGTNVRVEFHTGPTGGAWLGQMNDTQAYSGMGAPRLMRLADETAESNGELFNPDFISQLQSLRLSAIRTMQWSETPSFSNCISKPFTYDAPLGYITFASPYEPIAPFVGTITNTADAFTCSAAPDTPASITDGEMVYGIISSANTTTTPTLNIGGRGATPILNHYGGALAQGEIPIGTSAPFTYNATLGGYLYGSGGTPFGFDNRVPLAAIVALANEVGCDIWINLSPFAIDSEITSIAQYVRDNLNSSLKAYFEVANEVWGGVPHPADFIQELANFYSTGPAQVLGYLIRRFMALITTAWSPRSLSTLRRVAAWQEFGDPNGYNSACLQGQGMALMTSLGWDTAPNRPVDYVDVISYATYYEGPNCPAFQGGYIGNTTGVQAALYTAADNYASGIPASITSALNFVDNDVRAGTGGNGDTSTLAGHIAQYQNWENMVATYDSSRVPLQVVCYEGGLQIAPPTTGTLAALGVDTAYSAKIANLFNAYKNDPRCKQLVLDQFNQFMSHKHSVAPSWYEFVSDGSSGGQEQWTTHPGDLYSTPFQSFFAIQAFDATAFSPPPGFYGQTGVCVDF